MTVTTPVDRPTRTPGVSVTLTGGVMDRLSDDTYVADGELRDFSGVSAKLHCVDARDTGVMLYQLLLDGIPACTRLVHASQADKVLESMQLLRTWLEVNAPDTLQGPLLLARFTGLAKRLGYREMLALTDVMELVFTAPAVYGGFAVRDGDWQWVVIKTELALAWLTRSTELRPQA